MINFISIQQHIPFITLSIVERTRIYKAENEKEKKSCCKFWKEFLKKIFFEQVLETSYDFKNFR